MSNEIPMDYLVHPFEKKALEAQGFEGEHCRMALSPIDSGPPELLPRLHMAGDTMFIQLCFRVPLEFFSEVVQKPSRLILPTANGPQLQDPFQEVLHLPNLQVFVPTERLNDTGREAVQGLLRNYVSALNIEQPQGQRFLVFDLAESDGNEVAPYSVGMVSSPQEVDEAAGALIDRGATMVFVFDRLPDIDKVSELLESAEGAVDMATMTALGLVDLRLAASDPSIEAAP